MSGNNAILAKLINLFGDDESPSRDQRSSSVHSRTSVSSTSSDDEHRARYLQAQQNAGGYVGLVEPIDLARLDRSGHHRHLPTYDEVVAAAASTQSSRRARRHNRKHSRVISCESGQQGSKIYLFGEEEASATSAAVEPES